MKKEIFFLDEHGGDYGDVDENQYRQIRGEVVADYGVPRRYQEHVHWMQDLVELRQQPLIEIFSEITHKAEIK